MHFRFLSGQNAWDASRISAVMYSVNSASTFHGKFLSRPLHFMTKISLRQFPQKEGIAPYSAQRHCWSLLSCTASCCVQHTCIYLYSTLTCTAHWPVQLTDLYSTLPCTFTAHWFVRTGRWPVQLTGLHSRLTCTVHEKVTAGTKK
jgi:hypothetical protein